MYQLVYRNGLNINLHFSENLFLPINFVCLKFLKPLYFPYEDYFFSIKKMMNEFETMIRTKKTIPTEEMIKLTKIVIAGNLSKKTLKILFPCYIKGIKMNKTILVTGASGKIGSQIIKELIDKNFCVIGTYLKKIKLKKFLNQKFLPKNLINQKISDVKKLINFIAKENLDLRGVVNCAVLRPMKKGSNDSLQNWEKSIKVNSNAVYLLNDLFCKFFKKNLEGL